MRVVLDTGILIAALITTDTPPALIYKAWRKKRFELVWVANCNFARKNRQITRKADIFPAIEIPNALH